MPSLTHSVSTRDTSAAQSPNRGQAQPHSHLPMHQGIGTEQNLLADATSRVLLENRAVTIGLSDSEGQGRGRTRTRGGRPGFPHV